MKHLSLIIITLLLSIHFIMQKPLVHLSIHIFASILIAIVIASLARKYLSTQHQRSDSLYLMGQLLLLTLYYWEALPRVIPLLLCLFGVLTYVFSAKERSRMEKDFDRLKEELAHINETFKIVRSERHDFLKHISAIHFTLEKGEYKEAKQYLDELVGKYEETNLSIKGEKGVVAGVLNDAYRRAKKISFSPYFDLDIPISSLPMKDVDIVSLISNLLSNALDACEEWQQKREQPPQLSLEFSKRSGLYILICSNSSLPIPTEILDRLYHTYGLTTKGEEHEGLGTKIIHDIVESYHGFLDFTYKKEQFTVKIKIPAAIDYK